MNLDCTTCEYGVDGPCEKIYWTRENALVCPDHSEYQPPVPGCKCQWEIGDSPCPVHGEEEE